MLEAGAYFEKQQLQKAETLRGAADADGGSAAASLTPPASSQEGAQNDEAENEASAAAKAAEEETPVMVNELGRGYDN